MGTSHYAVYLFFICGLQTLLLISGQTTSERINETLTLHFSQTRHHLTNPQNKMAARDYIKREFESLGLTTESQMFATEQANVQGENIIGVLKGAYFDTADDSVVAISAHYDTMRNTPGVDDNGSGVAVMLEAARQLATKKRRNSTVLFIAFDFEEWEREADAACSRSTTLCGSKALVKDWLPSYFRHWPVRWLGLINMDTVFNFVDRDNAQDIPPGFDQLFPAQAASIKSDGSDGDFITVAGRTPEDQQILMDFNASWFGQGQPVYEIEMFPLSAAVRQYATDFYRSDHTEFWKANLTALFLTDSADHRGYMEQCYHQQCDNVTHITDDKLEFAAKIAGALVSWVDLLAPCMEACETGAAALLSASRFFTLVITFGLIMTSRYILLQ